MFDRIRLRLTIAYVGILALILVFVVTVAVAAFSRQASARQDDLLLQQAQSKANDLLLGQPEGPSTFPVGTLVTWTAVGPDGSFLPPLAPEPELLDEEHTRQAADEGWPLMQTVEGAEGDLRIVSYPVVEAGTVVAIVQTGQSRQVVRDAVRGLVLVLVPIGLGALALAAVGGLFMARRAMRPIQTAFDRQRAFVADASHELKTPLTLIRADAEVLHRGLKASEDRDLATDLLAETDRMNAVLSDLLLLARLDAGKLSVADKPFDLGAVIAETVGRFRARADAGEIFLEARVPGELGARGDAERTRQILAALLDNALRHTPPGGRVTVAGGQEGQRVQASVSDTGPGIAPEHLPRIFDRFYRAEAARTREGGGTGLGLTIARDLAVAQGGELTVESTEAEGARLHLKLPGSELTNDI